MRIIAKIMVWIIDPTIRFIYKLDTEMDKIRKEKQ